jgi:UDP-N-acetylmuramoyl-L-alanyl-D-glutamate--2,6-diaminopimelate ligase
VVLLNLYELFDELSGEKILKPSGESCAEVSEVVYDSRKIDINSGGILFACVPGERTDGHNFAGHAVNSGATALLCERAISGLPVDIPEIIVPNVRASMGEAAAILNGWPSKKMTMIAMTGTNGKTTAAYIMRSIMRAAEIVTGMLGTVVNDDGQKETDAWRTTPEGPDIQRILASMVQNGAECCVMEASSHGLHQRRLEGCTFDRAGFSNLTLEHLEYHGDMESYFEAKHLIFTDFVRAGWVAAVNADDEYGARILAEFPDNARGFSLRRASGGMYVCAVISADIDGSDLEIIHPDGKSYRVRSPFIGLHNAANVLESAVIADSLGIAGDVTAKGVSDCVQIPGRLERFRLGEFTAFVDFAHSPDGLEKVLSTLARLKKGRLWILWGAGGDRSSLKRPVAGEIMARLADQVIITNDNPRTERPETIARQVETGVISSGAAVNYEVILDREEAILSALGRAEPGDVVLIAGKGAENYIDYGDHKVRFNDSETIRRWALDHSKGS